MTCGCNLKQRMCIICRNRDNKENLIRIVRNPNGNIFFDETYKALGRGAYICNSENCITRAISKRSLNRVFKCNIDNSLYEKLKTILNN